MLMEEFEKMTGFKPMPEEYEKIEAAYYDFDGGKEEFCRAWVHGEAQRLVDDRARRIEQLKNQLAEQAKESRRREKDLIDRIERLKKTIDKLEDWKPYAGGTNMNQDLYLNILQSNGGITPAMARDLISGKFGFAINRIDIKRDAETYEVGNSGYVRVKDRYERDRAYASTDWNYIRFDAGKQKWELINGELKPYEG